MILESNLRASLKVSYSRLGAFIFKYKAVEAHIHLGLNKYDEGERTFLKHQESSMLLKRRTDMQGQLKDI